MSDEGETSKFSEKASAKLWNSVNPASRKRAELRLSIGVVVVRFQSEANSFGISPKDVGHVDLSFNIPSFTC